MGLHHGSLRWRQIGAPVFGVGLVASAVAAAFGRWQIAVAIPALYAAANLVVGVVELVRRRDQAMLLLPVIFPTMHVAWGIGFLMPGHPEVAASGSSES